MDKPVSDHVELHRLLHLHRWSNLEDWVRAFDRLADMTDDEITEVVTLAPGGPPADSVRVRT